MRTMVNQFRSQIRDALNANPYYHRQKIRNHIRKQFYEMVGYLPNFNAPRSFNEKIQWLKLNYHNPLMTLCADKVNVRNYIQSTLGDTYLVELLGIYDSVNAIDINELPDKFVLKVNHSSGQNIICRNRNELDWANAKLKLQHWMNPQSNHYFFSYDWCYKDIKPQIICEKYIDQEDLLEYKFLCFGGKAEMLYVCTERRTGLKIDFFDLHWNWLPFTRYYPNCTRRIPKPAVFDEMIHVAEKLAEPFPFVRVDLYEDDGKVLFGELTFYPGNGMERFDPVEWDFKVGELLQLPDKY